MKALTKEQSNAFLVAVIAAAMAHRLDPDDGTLVLLVREACERVFHDIGLTADETCELFDVPNVATVMSVVADMTSRAIYDAVREGDRVLQAQEFFRQFKASGGKVN